MLAVANLAAKAVPVAIAPDVHPVPAPALSVARTGQQTIHDLLVGVRRPVAQKGSHLFLCGRQSGQIERHASQQHPLVGGRQRLQLPLFVLGCDKGVDRVAHPGAVLDLRHCRTNWCPKRPVIALLLLRNGLRSSGIQRAIVRRSRIDPRHEVSDNPVGKLGSFVRHSRFMLVAELLQQETGAGLSGNDHRPIVTAAQQPVSCCQCQASLFELSTVTGETLLLQYRTDLFSEESNSRRQCVFRQSDHWRVRSSRRGDGGC